MTRGATLLLASLVAGGTIACESDADLASTSQAATATTETFTGKYVSVYLRSDGQAESSSRVALTLYWDPTRPGAYRQYSYLSRIYRPPTQGQPATQPIFVLGYLHRRGVPFAPPTAATPAYWRTVYQRYLYSNLIELSLHGPEPAWYLVRGTVTPTVGLTGSASAVARDECIGQGATRQCHQLELIGPVRTTGGDRLDLCPTDTFPSLLGGTWFCLPRDPWGAWQASAIDYYALDAPGCRPDPAQPSGWACDDLAPDLGCTGDDALVTSLDFEHGSGIPINPCVDRGNCNFSYAPGEIVWGTEIIRTPSGPPHGVPAEKLSPASRADFVARQYGAHCGRAWNLEPFAGPVCGFTLGADEEDGCTAVSTCAVADVHRAGDACAGQAGLWRCGTIRDARDPYDGLTVPQICRAGAWQTFALAAPDCCTCGDHGQPGTSQAGCY